ncbi:hypothetical protein [Flavobacterium litorale]|uniref:Uncharacterized protein n=1 Tax=Flavobacterium litorale TaxID=2856519 RepID=A0ABX8VB02_9FLAO|nr:hypothetical protein [Flavobacterium litorale]QYJ67990.1 hypothetical protein K1I41_10695 [Flavobacterium litorale]
MKTIYILLMFGVAFLALYEQSKQEPNTIVMISAIVLFMFGLMKLMAKVPSKHNRDNENDDV